MAVFKVKMKNKVDVDRKPRVYFTCHPDDFDQCFKKICDDIFKTHDCAIYYTEDMTEIPTVDEKEVDLGRSNLFVIPVTFKLLSTPNRAMDEDFPYAMKKHIPVLPIMMEPGIDRLYSKPDNFGELQYLTPHSTDLTEISYEDKLKKYLESVLISDALSKRVRAAFDAYIFLSYRKKDRKYANELMRLIHSTPECRDMAVWFDEYLTPGENFKENIEQILDDCDLFTLLVTPRLFEKIVDEQGEERDNYVISTELPLAQTKGIGILAVEMEETDKEALSAINIDNSVDAYDSEFRPRLLDAVSRFSLNTNHTPEHDFLIGLAYLNGIDVEFDTERAVSLLEAAARHGLTEATTALVDMYKNGIGVPCDIEKAIHWQTHYIELLTKSFKKTPIIANADELFWAQIEKGDLCLAASHIEDSERSYVAALDLVRHVNEALDALPLLNDAAVANTRLGNLYADKLLDIDRAIIFYRESLRLQTAACNRKNSAHHTRMLALCAQMLADAYRNKEQLDQAEQYLCEAISLLRTLSDSENQLKADRDLACCYERLGDVYKEYGQIDKSLSCHEEALTLRLRLNDIRETDESLRDLYVSHMQIGHLLKDTLNVESAEQQYQKALHIAEKRRANLPSVDAILTQAGICNSLCQLFLDAARFDDARECAQKSVYLCLTVKAAETPELLSTLSNAYEVLACVWEMANQNFAEAQKLYQQALELRTRLIHLSPSLNATRDLSIAYDNLGRMFANLQQFETAIFHYQKALDLCKQICATSQSSRAQHFLAITNDHMGDLYIQMKNPEKAIEHYQEALNLRHSIAKAGNSIECWYELAASYKHIGNVFFCCYDYETAGSCYENMLYICTQLAQSSNALQIQRFLMVAYGDMGKVFLAKNKLDKATEMLHAAYQLARELESKTGSIEAKQDLITTLVYTAQLSLAREDKDGAATIYKLILHLHVEIIKKSNTPHSWDAFATALLNAATVDTNNKEQHVMQAVQIYEDLCAKNPENTDYQQKLAYAKAMLAGQ